jgi:hypothetical protein
MPAGGLSNFNVEGQTRCGSEVVAPKLGRLVDEPEKNKTSDQIQGSSSSE